MDNNKFKYFYKKVSGWIIQIHVFKATEELVMSILMFVFNIWRIVHPTRNNTKACGRNYRGLGVYARYIGQIEIYTQHLHIL